MTQHPYPDSLSGSWLAVRLGVEPRMVDAMRRDGELLAVRAPGSQEWLYPAWQFAGPKPRAEIARIVSAARDAGLDDARLYEVLTAPLGLAGGRRRRLVDLLDDGRVDDVVEAVRAA